MLKNTNLINRYTQGKFIVNNKEYSEEILILYDRVIELRKCNITIQHYLESIALLEIDILLIGSSINRDILKTPIGLYLMEHNNIIHFEVMTIGSACRTHNILISESRSVVTYLSDINHA
ncbi:MTH938/NDUFAF3 family protein [Wolbachia endosymbiont of Howardula sp.]|uniref:MTH938/NDUFAF3 family protein n=1 Tax=Wolbachia endosymbiont of Howardula sp. TaxID=2916816 RepID=UPI00217EE12F|nr:MTH938/NDUFAF3 family protein [Wolbachia endosymbiont of Howardula sp.]UWI83300.1 MTH938/NDUFAF3 family protein [Wolbachia endosymbiont of Howardula sp.]